jgi:hypothetical protein
MTDVTTAEPEDGVPEGPPPWINPEMQQRIQWRDGDIVISVPAKSGTTWTMNIVHQLRSGGDDGFVDVYAEVPWLEFVPAPDADIDELVARFDQMPDHRRRAFKTHSAPGELPYLAPGDGADVSYVVVMRNPDEAIASMRPFLDRHSDAWWELWGIPKEPVIGPDFAAFFSGMGQGLLFGVFAFLAAWWPLRHNDNVLFVHYADLVREPEAQIRRISDFLGFEVDDRDWPSILEYTSFTWMKANEDKFELCSLGEITPLDRGAMLRKGKVGTAAEDGVTDEMSVAIGELGAAVVADDAALTWLYEGGPLP